MKSIDKRISQLEAVTLDKPDEPFMTLGELYEWQETPEGQAELAKLYDENRNESA